LHGIGKGSHGTIGILGGGAMNDLLNYIRQHGMVCAEHNGRILAWCAYSHEYRLESIQPTLRDVLNWLGY